MPVWSGPGIIVHVVWTAIFFEHDRSRFIRPVFDLNSVKIKIICFSFGFHITRIKKYAVGTVGVTLDNFKNLPPVAWVVKNFYDSFIVDYITGYGTTLARNITFCRCMDKARIVDFLLNFLGCFPIFDIASSICGVCNIDNAVRFKGLMSFPIHLPVCLLRKVGSGCPLLEEVIIRKSGMVQIESKFFKLLELGSQSLPLSIRDIRICGLQCEFSHLCIENIGILNRFFLKLHVSNRLLVSVFGSHL